MRRPLTLGYSQRSLKGPLNMERTLFLFQWNAAEAEKRAAQIRATGWTVEIEAEDGKRGVRNILSRHPTVVAFDLGPPSVSLSASCHRDPQVPRYPAPAAALHWRFDDEREPRPGSIPGRRLCRARHAPHAAGRFRRITARANARWPVRERSTLQPGPRPPRQLRNRPSSPDSDSQNGLILGAGRCGKRCACRPRF